VSAAVVAREVVAAAGARGVARATGVAWLWSGDGVIEIDTQFPGGMVVGVVVGDEAVTVHLVIDRLPVAEGVADARATGERVLARLGVPLRLDLVVNDLNVDRLPDLNGHDRGGRA
jgi:hypothetical protein